MSFTAAVFALLALVPFPPEHRFDEKLDEYFKALAKLERFNGCLQVKAGEGVVLRRAYNISTDPGHSLYVTEETQFDIHSVSKLMANAAIVKLEAEGRLSRQDPLEKYISGFPQGNRITVTHLMEHRSGLPRELSAGPRRKLDLTPEEIVELAKREKLEFEPGTDRRYSNVGFELLHYVILRVTAKPFAAYLQEEIFARLQMKSSGAHFDAGQENLKRLAVNHQQIDGKLVRVDNVLPDEFRTARIYSTADDLMRFLDFVGQEPYKAALAAPDGVIQKNGGSDGVRAQVYTHTRAGYSFVLLANDDEIPFEQIVKDVVSILENKPFEMPREIHRRATPVSGEVLQRYAGKYVFPEANHTELEFRVEGPSLVLYQDGEKLAVLFAESETVFFEDPKSSDSFEFVQDPATSHRVLWDFKGARLKGTRGVIR